MSKETQLSVLSFVPDVSQEIDRMKIEDYDERLDPQVDLSLLSQKDKELSDENE